MADNKKGSKPKPKPSAKPKPSTKKPAKPKSTVGQSSMDKPWSTKKYKDHLGSFWK